MNNNCPPPKVLNPRTGKCVSAAYLKKLNNKKAVVNEQINDIVEVPAVPAVPFAPTILDVPDVPDVPDIAKDKPKKGVKTTDYKQSIIENLKILEDYEKLNKEPFKARAYSKVIDSIELFPGSINNMDDLKNINGIGDKINAKIKELIETGKMTAVENALNDPRFSLQKKLGKLYGVGPVKINELMNKISTFEELYEHPELLNEKQKIGLKYYNDMNMRIPMSEGKKHYKIIDKIFKKVYKDIEFELVGSYRRKNKDMGDIDILIKNRDDLDIKNLITELTKGGYIIETLASGKSKFMGLCKLSPELPARRIDILIADPSYYYFALLYFTGSYSFNIYMRRIALEKGYSLSEYGIKNNTDKKFIDTKDLINSEEDIFKFLDMKYVPPNKRNIV
jgi:DNA polymerase beta